VTSVTALEGKSSKPKKQRLTPRQARFAKEYVNTGVGAEAARRAGYEPDCAAQTANEILSYPHVGEEVRKWRERLKERLEISAEKIKNDVAHISERAAIEGDNQAALKGQDLLAKMVGAYAPSVSVHVDASAAHLQALLNLARRKEPKTIDQTDIP